ncbi:hypothetical protein AB0N81_31520 [Streptomyces sp. NPDC093510]|uniref:hypothetical protein n=1 Tax=Streptomyces sp. NPDC093510 TaxID=3155199 RepID=UPI0034408DA6
MVNWVSAVVFSEYGEVAWTANQQRRSQLLQHLVETAGIAARRPRWRPAAADPEGLNSAFATEIPIVDFPADSSVMNDVRLIGRARTVSAEP